MPIHIWKDKDGNKLTFKEFMAKWKEGLEKVNPYQQSTTQLTATKIMLLGILIGLVVSIVNYKTGYWLAILLFGALLNTSVQLIGLKQKIKTLKPLFTDDEEAIDYQDTLKVNKDSEYPEIKGGKNVTLDEMPEELIEEYKTFDKDIVAVVTGEEKGMSSMGIKIEDIVKELEPEEIKEPSNQDLELYNQGKEINNTKKLEANND